MPRWKVKYAKSTFVIFQEGYDYIVFNKRGKFEDNHTHIKDLGVGRLMIKLVMNRELPESKSERFITSLIRLSNDEDYIEKLKLLLQESGDVEMAKCGGGKSSKGGKSKKKKPKYVR